MAYTPPPSPDQSYLPAPPKPPPRGVPRPTPIGMLVGLVGILLCLGGVALAAVLTNALQLGGAPTPTARGTATTQTPGTATVAGTAQASTSRTSLPGAVATTGALTAVAQTSPPASSPAQPPPVATGGSLLTPPGTMLSVPTAAPGAPGAPTLVPNPAPVGGDVLPTGAFSDDERRYIAAFNSQVESWNNGLIAFNVEMQTVNPKDAGWLQNIRTTTGQMREIAKSALALPAPPRLLAIDAEYKAAARHFDQGMQLINEWVGGNQEVVHQFNVEMSEGSAALQTAINQMKAFTTGGAAGGPTPATTPGAARTVAPAPSTPGGGVPSNKPPALVPPTATPDQPLGTPGTGSSGNT
jgi:hypothetical protein